MLINIAQNIVLFWVYSASASDVDMGFFNILQAIVTENTTITWPNTSPNYQIIGHKLGTSSCLAQDRIISNNPSNRKDIIQAVLRWLPLSENRNCLCILTTLIT